MSVKVNILFSNPSSERSRIFIAPAPNKVESKYTKEDFTF